MVDNAPSTITPPAAAQPEISPADAQSQIAGLLDIKGSQLPPPTDEEVADGPDTPSEHGDYESDDGDEPSSDTADDESDPSGEDDQADDSETNQSSIDPPASWSASEKKMFATLSPEAQSVIARRESERDAATNRGMQQLAEHRKAYEAQVEAANQEQNRYANNLNSVLNWVIPELQEYANTDWVKLASEDRDEYIRRQANYNDLQQRASFIQAEVGKAQQAQYAQAQESHRNHVREQAQLLVQEMPEFGDQRKFDVLVKDIKATMANYNFSESEITSVADARVVKVMARLAQLERQEAAKKSALTKRSGAPAPKVLPVSSSQQPETSSKKRVQEQFARLKRTGSPHDAAKLIEQLL